MAISYSSLPPQLQQLLAEQFGVRTPEDAQRLAQRLTENPEELVATLQQLGINLSPEQASAVAGEAADWMDQKAQAQADAGGEAGEVEEAEPPKPPAPDEEEESSEPAPGEEEGDADDEEYDQGESAAEPDSPEAAQGEGSPQSASSSGGADDGESGSDRTSAATEKAVNDLLSRAAGGRGVPSVRGGVAAARQRSDLDALITEMMSAGQQAGGTLPQQSNFKVPRPVMPHSKSTSASNDPRMQKMIADIYRTVANQSSGPERAYTPSGDRS